MTVQGHSKGLFIKIISTLLFYEVKITAIIIIKVECEFSK